MAISKSRRLRTPRQITRIKKPSVGNLLFPDNPNRKLRSEELHRDLVDIEKEISETHELYESTAALMEPLVGDLILTFGYKTLSDLNADARRRLSGSLLTLWEDVQDVLGNTSSESDHVMGAVASLLALSGNTSFERLVAVDSASVKTSRKGLKVIQGALLVAGTSGPVAAGLTAAVLKERLTDSIEKQIMQRREAQTSLECLRALHAWSKDIRAHFAQMNRTAPVAEAMTSLRKFAEMTPDACLSWIDAAAECAENQLQRLDIERQSYTKDDPANCIAGSAAVECGEEL